MVSISTYQFQMRSNESDDSAEWKKKLYVSCRMCEIYPCWTNDFTLKMLFCSQQISKTQLFYENDDHGNDDDNNKNKFRYFGNWNSILCSMNFEYFIKTCQIYRVTNIIWHFIEWIFHLKSHFDDKICAHPVHIATYLNEHHHSPRVRLLLSHFEFYLRSSHVHLQRRRRRRRKNMYKG